MDSRQALIYPRPYHFEINRDEILTFLESLPDESVDMFLTDLPYPSLESHRAIGTTTRLKHAWFPVIHSMKKWARIFRLMHGALRGDRHAYLMVDQTSYRDFFPLLSDAGFTVWKALIWRKPRIGMGYHYRAQHELILFAEKGKRRLRSLSVPDVLDAKLRPGERLDYPTQKPEALGEVLVSQSAYPGELVCDPFMGCGSFGAAALSLGCAFLGNDSEPLAVELSTARLSLIGTHTVFRLRGQPRLF